MKPAQILLAVAASTLPTTSAIALHRREDGLAPRVLSLDLHRNNVRDPAAHDRHREQRRSGAIDVDLDNDITLYYFNASLGTPKQEFRLHIDTGSSDLWVNTVNSSLCSSSSSDCSDSGTYSANDSSTYEYVGSYFNISYADGSGASGDYATDNFYVGNTTISDLQFGIGYTSTSSDSILGIGYTTNEVQVGVSGKSAYSNLPAKMVAEGKIASNAYSIFLNDLDASTGTIIFGGVDQEQYSGSLVTVPVQKNGGTYSEFFITMTGLTLDNTTIAEDIAMAVLLDTGTSLTYLPSDYTDTIFDAVGAVYEEDEGLAFVPCSLASDTGNMTFKFSDPAEIVVPISDLVIDVMSVTGGQLSFTDGTAACMFGIAPSTSTYVLGDSFMRSAYVVFDLSNNEISIAQSKFNATTSDIVEIGTGDDAVPKATAVSSPVAAESGLSSSSSSSSFSNGNINGGDESSGSSAGVVRPYGSGKAMMGVMTLVFVFAGFLI